MKVLLTGGTGLLGSHILEQGLKQGLQFVIPHRKISKRSYLLTQQDNPAITLIPFSFDEDIEKLFLNEIDAVINSAAMLSPFEKDHEQMNFINLEFPKRLYQASVRNKISYFCQISSNSVYGSLDKNKVINETDTHNPRSTHYTKTKREFDLWLDTQQEIPHSTVHPGFMLDTHDSKPSSGAVLLALKMKKFNFYLNRTKNIVSAKDVAVGIMNLIHKKALGHFLLGGENIQIKELLKLCCNEISRDFSELKEVNYDEIQKHPIEKEFCLTQPFSSEKAKTALKYNISDNATQSLNRSLNWFKEKRILR